MTAKIIDNSESEYSEAENLKAGGLARTSSILGAASLPLSWMIFGVLIAILAIALSAMGFADDKAPNKLKKKCLKTGLFCGITSIILHVVLGLMMTMTNARLSQSRKTTSQMSPEVVQQITKQPNIRNRKKPDNFTSTAAESTFSQLKEKAGNGDAAAQADLGAMYQLGRGGVRQDYKEAYRWLTKAAKQDHAPAQFLLGMMYAEGQGVVQDDKEAFKWLSKAAEQGLAQAQLIIGTWYLGYPSVSQDYIKAVEFITKSAEQGYAPAQFLLGQIYDNGEVVLEDDKEAFKLYRKAAEQGWPPAQYDLGLMYTENKDYVEAYKWLILAHKNGEDTSEAKLLLQNILSPNQTMEAENRAKAFVEHKSATPFTSDTIEGFYKGNKYLH